MARKHLSANGRPTRTEVARTIAAMSDALESRIERLQPRVVDVASPEFAEACTGFVNLHSNEFQERLLRVLEFKFGQERAKATTAIREAILHDEALVQRIADRIIADLFPDEDEEDPRQPGYPAGALQVRNFDEIEERPLGVFRGLLFVALIGAGTYGLVQLVAAVLDALA